MAACCLNCTTLPNPKDYFPSKAEVKDHIYGLFASVFVSSIICGASQGLLAGLGYISSYGCYRLIDFVGDALFKGHISEDKLNLIKNMVKVAGTAFCILFSYKVLHYPLDTMIVSFLIYYTLTSYLSLVDPLPLVSFP